MVTETRKCIICENIKDVSCFNEEHIIPESLGNKALKIYSVCKRCNELLGEKIDSELVNNVVAEGYRHIHKIRGKKGHIPHPFEYGRTAEGKLVRLDENFKPHWVVPNIDIERIGEHEALIHYNGGRDIDAAIKAINKKLKRNGIPKLSDAQLKDMRENAVVTQEHSSLNYQFKEVNFDRLKLAYMKIAYEFGYYLWGKDYLNDLIAQEIRERIYGYIYNDVIYDDLNNYARWDSFDFSILTDLLVSDKNLDYSYRHTLVSSGTISETIMAIIIFPKMHCSVRYCTNDNRFKKMTVYVVQYPGAKIFQL